MGTGCLTATCLAFAASHDILGQSGRLPGTPADGMIGGLFDVH